MAVKNEGKLNKKRLPLFDIALLAVLIFGVIGVAYLMTHRAEVPEVELVYTVRIEDVDNAYSGTYVQGGKLYSPSGLVMGEIESVSVARAVDVRFDESVLTEDGEYRYIETRSAEKSDVTVTVRVTAEVRNNGYFVESNRIAAGMQVETMVAGYFGEGLILTVTPIEETPEGESTKGAAK